MQLWSRCSRIFQDQITIGIAAQLYASQGGYNLSLFNARNDTVMSYQHKQPHSPCSASGRLILALNFNGDSLKELFF